jgi:hypothetical protein
LRGRAAKAVAKKRPQRVSRGRSLALPFVPIGEDRHALINRQAEDRSGLNPEHPNRDDNPENGWARYCPARHVNRTVRLRPVHHVILPVRHRSLRELFSALELHHHNYCDREKACHHGKNFIACVRKAYFRLGHGGPLTPARDSKSQLLVKFPQPGIHFDRIAMQHFLRCSQQRPARSRRSSLGCGRTTASPATLKDVPFGLTSCLR